MCYLWVTDQERNWNEAENFCKSKGGHLASVTSLDVHNFMLEWAGLNKTKVWIGATDQEREGTWIWSDCSSYNFEGWVHNATGKRKENCAELYNTNEHEKGWNDLECKEQLNFVCATRVCSGNTTLRKGH